MAAERGRGAGWFFTVAAFWLVGLVGLALLYQVATWPAQWDSLSFEETALLLPGWLGVLLPAGAFAGGLAISGISPHRGVALRAALLAMVTYALLAYGAPLAEFRLAASQEMDVASQYPFGPYTPGILLEIREVVRADPPAAYSFRTSRPLETPPNWWTYLIHSVMAVAAFTLLAAVVGKEVGVVTRALPPPTRSNVRWGLGLATVVAFFVAEGLCSRWVRSDPGNSGLVAGWIMLSVPLVELGILRAVALHKARHLHASGSSGV
jgi:hypothetical protein